MTDLLRKVERARSLIQTEWSDADTERAQAGAIRLQVRERRVRQVVVGAIVLASVGVGFGLTRGERPQAQTNSAPTATSSALDLGATATQALTSDHPPMPPPNDSTALAIPSPTANTPEMAATTSASSQQSDPALQRARQRARLEVAAGSATTVVAPPWKVLANEGKYAQAYALLPSESTAESAEDLLLAADVARKSGHAREALNPLQGVLARHATERSASIAAFTLGRVYLDDLSEPARAADAFAKCRSLAPAGALSEDALAREVEARSKAGFPDRAHVLAEEYVRLYPAGVRLTSVKRYGSLP